MLATEGGDCRTSSNRDHSSDRFELSTNLREERLKIFPGI